MIDDVIFLSLHRTVWTPAQLADILTILTTYFTTGLLWTQMYTQQYKKSPLPIKRSVLVPAN
jgi:hypothetical protein